MAAVVDGNDSDVMLNRVVVVVVIVVFCIINLPTRLQQSEERGDGDKGLLVVERGGCRCHRLPVTVYRNEISPGNASFKNRAMVWHAQMLPPCHTIAWFSKDGQVLSIPFRRLAPEGGRDYGLIGRLVVGAQWTVHFWNGGKAIVQLKKIERQLDQKNKKPDRPSLSHKKIRGPHLFDWFELGLNVVCGLSMD